MYSLYVRLWPCTVWLFMFLLSVKVALHRAHWNRHRFHTESLAPGTVLSCKNTKKVWNILMFSNRTL